MNELDTLARFFLSFSHLLPVVTFWLIGLLFINRALFFQVLLLVLFTFLFNPWLKFLFHIPLNPELHIAGFAFPSGHMQFALVFYGWLLWHTPRRWLQGVILVILAGIAWGLVHFGYHNWFDIAGAFGFASLTLIGFNYLPKPIRLVSLMALASLLFLTLLLLDKVPFHSLIAFCMLVVLYLLRWLQLGRYFLSTVAVESRGVKARL